MRNCVKCGEEFEPKHDVHFFCSDKCRRAIRGSEYRRQRARALLRDGYTCTECGAVDKLECHHMTPLCFGGTHEVDNLQTLCRPCHKNKHRRWKYDQQQQRTRESEIYYHAA